MGSRNDLWSIPTQFQDLISNDDNITLVDTAYGPAIEVVATGNYCLNISYDSAIIYTCLSMQNNTVETPGDAIVGIFNYWVEGNTTLGIDIDCEYSRGTGRYYNLHSSYIEGLITPGWNKVEGIELLRCG